MPLCSRVSYLWRRPREKGEGKEEKEYRLIRFFLQELVTRSSSEARGRKEKKGEGKRISTSFLSTSHIAGRSQHGRREEKKKKKGKKAMRVRHSFDRGAREAEARGGGEERWLCSSVLTDQRERPATKRRAERAGGGEGENAGACVFNTRGFRAAIRRKGGGGGGGGKKKKKLPMA